MLKKCLIMIEGNVVDIIYVGELEIYTILMYHCASYSVAWPTAYCSVVGP